MVRYGRGHKDRIHRRIVKNAARRFRAEGVEGAGLARVMQASGLTVGGFYKHFESKDELLAKAIVESFHQIRDKLLSSAKQAPPGEGWKAIVRTYLSMEHCEHPDVGCPIAALAPDMARVKPSVKKQIAGAMKQHRDELMVFVPGQNSAEK